MPPRQAVQVEHGHRLQAVSLASDLAGIGFSLSFCQVAGLALPCPRARARSLAGAVVGSLARKKGNGTVRRFYPFWVELLRNAGSRFLAVLAVSTPRGRATPVRVRFSFVSF
jgi:hypothetical protein